MDDRIKAYMERMDEIRKLSSPSIEGIDSADEYEEKLLDNFTRIGELGAENRRVIKEMIEPIISSDEPLTKEEKAIINEIEENLYDSLYASGLDMPMVSLLHERSSLDISDIDDDNELIEKLNTTIDMCYIMMAHTGRIVTALDLAKKLQKRGLEAFEIIKTYVDHDKFIALSIPARKHVIVNMSYAPLLYHAELYEKQEDKWAVHEKKCEALLEVEKLTFDDFYHEAIPKFRWDVFRYAIYYYFAYMDDEDVPPKYMQIAIEKIREAIRLFKEAPDDAREYYESLYSLDNLYASLYGKQYVAGELSFSEYKEKIQEICKNLVVDESGRTLNLANNGMIYNNLVRKILTSKYISEEDEEFISDYYREFVADTFHMQIDDDFSNLVTGLFNMLYHFTEIPGAMGYEEIGMKLFAAIHPPTYIHSTMVAKISKCLAKHMLRLMPEKFVGICDCKDAEEVEKNKHLILDYTYHAALCHDFGKLGIMDTIYIYGRALLDSEFGLLKEHPLLGAELLRRHTSTRPYADVSLGHHRWYDDTKGYPPEFITADSPVKTIIDIVTCADCMDAATDSVGRSYSTGKTFEQYEAEVAEGAGTRYAPYFPELFKDPEVRNDIKWLLSEGRHKAYRNTYYLLREMQK